MEISNPTTTSGLYLGDYETNNEYDPINHSVFEPNHISNQNVCFNQSNYNDTVELNNNNDSILSPNNVVDNQILSIDAKANDTNSHELTSNDKVVPYLVDTRNFLSESMYHIPNQSDNEIIQPDPISLPLQNYYSVSPYQNLQRQNSLPQPGSSSNYDGTINDYRINGSSSSLQLVIFNDDNDNNNNNNSNSNNINNNDSAYKSDGNQNSPLIDPPTPPSQYLSQTPINQRSGGEPIKSIRNPIDPNQHTIDPINSLQNQISNVSGISSTLKRRGGEFIDNQPTTSNYSNGPKYKDKKNNQQDSLLTQFVPYSLSHVGSETPTKSLPRHIKPRIATTYWSDEKTVCYQVEAHGVLVSRREDTNYVNGTKLLNLAGMSRGKRDGILKSEKIKTVIKMGSMNLKGVWIPFERASEIARNEGLDDILFPLFVRDLKGYFERKGWSLKKDGLITATEDYSEFNN